MSEKLSSDAELIEKNRKEFFGDGIFEWQKPVTDRQEAWNRFSYSKERWWGTFPAGTQEIPNLHESYPWAIGPFHKYENNPVIAPTPDTWDQGHFGGGVHNGSILIKDGTFYYIYRGEQPLETNEPTFYDYICDIGVATSDDGIHFTKRSDVSPFFRKGEDARYSYEDVNVSKHGDTYYLFCNQWFWGNNTDPKINGTFLATSKDLLHWEKKGLVFPAAKRIHRNGVVLQNPQNEAVRIDGKFWMYLNDRLMASSTDMLNWESIEIASAWPGGEGCFALADHDPKNPDHVILFTGGNHTGNFYAVGEVLFSKKNLTQPLEYLPQPVLKADPRFPYENGFSVEDPKKMISGYSDCIFFNGMTYHQGKWWVYYGGSEYYTCLART